MAQPQSGLQSADCRLRRLAQLQRSRRCCLHAHDFAAYPRPAVAPWSSVPETTDTPYAPKPSPRSPRGARGVPVSPAPYNTYAVSVVCIHFTVFLFTFIAAPSSLTVVRKRTDYTRNESSWEHSFQKMKDPGNFCSRERKFPLGTLALRSENTGQRKVPIPLLYTITPKHTIHSQWICILHVFNPALLHFAQTLCKIRKYFCFFFCIYTSHFCYWKCLDGPRSLFTIKRRNNTYDVMHFT